MNQRILRFSFVGGLGFIVDSGLLVILVTAGTGFYSARLVSFPIAATVTWYLNRLWTFDTNRIARPAQEYITYLAVQLVAALANFLVYAMLLRFVLGERLQLAVVALAVGAVAGLMVNYTGSRGIVFVGRD